MVQKKNIRLTSQRNTILNIFHKCKERNYHPTAEEVYEEAKKHISNISLGTIYRNLNVLGDSGYIKEIRIKDRKSFYDGNTDSHFHLFCSQCESLIDIKEPVEVLYNKKSFKMDYKIEGFLLSFFGSCYKCKEKEG